MNINWQAFWDPKEYLATPALFLCVWLLLLVCVYLPSAAMLSYFQKSTQFKIYSISATIVLTLWEGMSRVYLGVYYPTDVLAE